MDTEHPMTDIPEETTVMFVDDQEEILDLFTMFTSPICSVKEATNGKEALETINDDVDVLFLDRRMPEKSGDEVLDEIRSCGYDIPVCMISGVDPQADILNMPFDDYITKPVEREQLLQKIDLLLSHSDLKDANRRFYRLASKRRSLQNNADNHHEEIHQLTEEMRSIRNEIDDQLDALFDGEDARALIN